MRIFSALLGARVDIDVDTPGADSGSGRPENNRSDTAHTVPDGFGCIELAELMETRRREAES